MSFIYIQYEYPIDYLFHKELLWINKDCSVYFAFKHTSSDDWSFYAGNASHALDTGQLLTSYGTSEALAQTNYLNTTKDLSGKFLAILPANFLAKFARLYIMEGDDVTIHEWIPSVYIVANEIVSGTLELTDMLIDAPLIKVVKSSVDRLKIGNFSGENYGLIGYDTSGNRVFEISNAANVIGGLEIGKDYIQISGEIIIDAASSEIRTEDFASGNLGRGWRINKENAEFQNILARGKLSCSVFEKETYSAVGGNLIITEADVLEDDMSAQNTSKLKISGSASFVSGEIVRVKDSVANDEWIEITDVSAAPEYSVNRDLLNNYPSGEKPIWKKGTAVVSMGYSGEGFIAIESGVQPKMSVYKRNSSVWNDYGELLRFGNLLGFLGVENNIYGIGIGNDEAYLKYAPSIGLQIRGVMSGSDIVGGTIEGSTFKTGTTGRRVEINSEGIVLITGAITGKYGTFKYGTSTKYGSGVLAWLNNVVREMPLYISGAGGRGDIHYYNRGGTPTGLAEIGDTCVVSGKLMVCISDGTPGTWEVAGDQTA